MRLRGEYLLCVEDEELDRHSRGSNGLIAPVMYQLSGRDKDSLFMARVIDMGPGKLEAGTRRVQCVERGQMIMMLANNVSYRVTLQQRPHYIVQNRFVAGVLHREDYRVEPKQHFMLVQADPERARRATIGKGVLHLASVEVATDDVKRHAGIQAEYGVVLALGPGAWVDGHWCQPECKVGDLILYDKSHSTVPITIKGKPYTLVPSDMLILSDPLEAEEVEVEQPQRTAKIPVVQGTMTTGPRPHMDDRF